MSETESHGEADANRPLTLSQRASAGLRAGAEPDYLKGLNPEQREAVEAVDGAGGRWLLSGSGGSARSLRGSGL